MKKKFSASGATVIVRIISNILAIGIFLGSGIYLVIDLSNGNNGFLAWLSIIFAFFLTILCIVAFVSAWHNKIIFFEDRIIVTGENFEEGEKTQYQDEIFFKDIEDVKIVVSRNQNSLKKWYKSSGNRFKIRDKKPFFDFIIKNQDSKWICVYDFSIKQRKEMLKIINEKTGLNIDYDDIYSKREEIDV